MVTFSCELRARPCRRVSANRVVMPVNTVYRQHPDLVCLCSGCCGSQHMPTGSWRTWKAWIGQTASKTCSATGSAGPKEPSSSSQSKVGNHPSRLCQHVPNRKFLSPSTRCCWTLHHLSTPLVACVGGEGAALAEGACLEVFTTRPDTIFGATYMVVAPEHPLLEGLVSSAQQAAVQQYVAEAAQKSDLERTELQKVKTGVDTGQPPATKLVWAHSLMACVMPVASVLVQHCAYFVQICPFQLKYSGSLSAGSAAFCDLLEGP